MRIRLFSQNARDVRAQASSPLPSPFFGFLGFRGGFFGPGVSSSSFLPFFAGRASWRRMDIMSTSLTKLKWLQPNRQDRVVRMFQAGIRRWRPDYPRRGILLKGKHKGQIQHLHGSHTVVLEHLVCYLSQKPHRQACVPGSNLICKGGRCQPLCWLLGGSFDNCRGRLLKSSSSSGAV